MSEHGPETDEILEQLELSLRMQRSPSSVIKPEFSVRNDADIIEVKHLPTGVIWEFKRIGKHWQVGVTNWVICPALASVRTMSRLHRLADEAFKKELEKL